VHGTGRRLSDLEEVADLGEGVKGTEPPRGGGEGRREEKERGCSGRGRRGGFAGRGVCVRVFWLVYIWRTDCPTPSDAADG
jgi:hypothetical protein